MQSVVTTNLDTADIYTDNKRPSTKLQEKIRNCVSMFRSLNETVNEIVTLGEQEGFTKQEISHFIRQEMTKAEIPPRTITRYLPAELKRNYKPRHNNLAKMANLPPQKQTFTFKTRIGNYSRGRHVIVLTNQMARDIKPFLNKEINVTLSG